MRNVFRILSVLPVFFLAAHLQGSVYLNGFQKIIVYDEHPLNGQAKPDAYKISGSNITVEAWIFPIELPAVGEKYVLVGRTGKYKHSQITNNFAAYELSIDNSGTENNPVLAFAIQIGPEAYDIRTVKSSMQINQEVWTHVAGTYDGTTLRVFINGQLVGSAEASGEIQKARSSFNIGSSRGPRPTYFRFYGLIEEVRLWNITRSETQIADSMNVALTGNEQGLVGYWPLSDVTNGLTSDLTTNHNDLRVEGKVSSASLGNMNGKTAHLVVDTSPIDFGVIERPAGGLDSLLLQNSGDGYLYGQIHSTNPDIIVPAEFGRYFLDPGDEQQHQIKIVPKIKGDFSGNLIFDQGNADNLGVQIPFTGESVRKQGFDANNIDMWVGNDGIFSYHHGAGLEWPKYSEKKAVYSSGIWVGAKVNGEVHSAISAQSSYIEEFTPGPIIDGHAGDPDNPDYRVYKIEKGDNAENNPDYANWPVQLGAPVNSDGTPAILGDQMLWVVYNDLDPDKHSKINSIPLGVEIQQSVFGWNEDGPLGNTVFLRFKLINKSNDVWQDTYFALWSDPDLGVCYDDFIGVDTVRCLGYCYNARPEDRIYGDKPPAVGYDFLKGAFYTKPIQGFAFYDYLLPYPYHAPRNGKECYNYLQGKLQNGLPYLDPNTAQPSPFPLNGDPVTGQGWIDSNMGDRRFLLSTGPFDLEPGQAKEIVAAIVVAQGDDNLSSVTALRDASDAVQQKYDEGDLFGGAVENVTVGNVNGGATDTLNDLANSGAEFEMTGGDSGATLEVATFIEAPPGAEEITRSAIHGMGKYIDVQVNGDIEWPMKIKMYYTQSDLDQAGIDESDILGLYYWSAARDEWVLYSNSGDDDQGRGPSTTGVNTENLEIDGIHYEGYVWAEAYHLTPMRMGSDVDSALVGITYHNRNVPEKFFVRQNYPNPFNATTTVEYGLPMPARVSFTIYNVIGQKVAMVDAGAKPAGNYRWKWNAVNCPSGVYFVRMQCVSLDNQTAYSRMRKMLLLK